MVNRFREVTMGAAIALREDYDAADLRRIAKGSKDAAQSRRLLSLAEIYAGGRRTDAARIGATDLQVIRDWVLRFNALGPSGLLDRKAPGTIHPNSTLRSARPWRQSSSADRSRRSMAWYAGG